MIDNTVSSLFSCSPYICYSFIVFAPYCTFHCFCRVIRVLSIRMERNFNMKEKDRKSTEYQLNKKYCKHRSNIFAILSIAQLISFVSSMCLVFMHLFSDFIRCSSTNHLAILREKCPFFEYIKFEAAEIAFISEMSTELKAIIYSVCIL